MGFLQQLLARPANERAFALIPVGYRAEGCEVPELQRKPLDEILIGRDATQRPAPTGSDEAARNQ